MKRICLLAATLATSLPLPASAQTQIPAPAGWTSQTKAGGARTFTPPDLRAGEKYSVTVYESVSLGGKTPAAYLRGFAGAVGKTVGNLAAPLLVRGSGQAVVGTGAYVGPKGTGLGVAFIGVSFDGATIHVERVLFSNNSLFERYKVEQDAISRSLMKRARDEAGDNLQITPPQVTHRMTPGGELVPGVYAGNQYHDRELVRRLRVYIYASGEYRVCNDRDEDIKGDWIEEHVGQIKYNRNSGKLDVESVYDLANGSGSDADADFCYYGRDARGKPAIYVEHNTGIETHTLLLWVGPPTKRLSASQVKARAIEEARFKWVTAPGSGVQSAQIAAIVNNYIVNFDGMSSHVTQDVTLLLRDGTSYKGLPVAPDQLDIARSRQHEPQNWGKWRATGRGYQVSWAGKPYATLPGQKVLPAPTGAKLSGRFGAVRASSYGLGGSYSYWGATFSPDGRFRKDERGGSSTNSYGVEGVPTVTSGYDENGSGVAGQANGASFSSVTKRNPNGGNEGRYSVSGYTLTLRYDNGRVVRLPFFFANAKKRDIWFEGNRLSLDVTN